MSDETNIDPSVEIGILREQITALEKEKVEAADLASSFERDLNIRILRVQELESQVTKLTEENSALTQRISTLEGDLLATKKKAETYRKGFETQTALHEQSMKRTAALSKVVGRDAAEALPIGAKKLLADPEQPETPQ